MNASMDAEPRPAVVVPPPKTWAHRLARWTILPLVHSRVTPNHLTTARLVTGVAAAGAFAMGDYLWTVCGGVLFVISALLDRADGELARVSGRCSPGGHRYDMICDVLVNVLLFVGIGIGLSTVLGTWGPALGVIAGGAVGAIFAVVARLETAGASAEEAFGSAAGFDPDDALFLIGPVAWFDALLPLLLAAAVGAPAFLLFAWWRYHRIRAAA